MIRQEQAFDIVETIINDIIKGKRKHIQDTFHAEIFHDDIDDEYNYEKCGTAHCIAGWAFIDIADIYKIKPELEEASQNNMTPMYNDSYYFESIDVYNENEIYEAVKDAFGERRDLFEEEYEEIAEHGESMEWNMLTVLLGIEYEYSELLFGPRLNIFEIKENFYKLKDRYLGTN